MTINTKIVASIQDKILAMIFFTIAGVGLIELIFCFIDVMNSNVWVSVLSMCALTLGVMFGLILMFPSQPKECPKCESQDLFERFSHYTSMPMLVGKVMTMRQIPHYEYLCNECGKRWTE